MHLADDTTAMRRYDLTEVLFTATSLGLPRFFSIEWLLDRAERRDCGTQWP